MKRTIEYIEKIVCAVRGFTPAEIRERNDKGKLIKFIPETETRQLVMYFALKNGHTLAGASGYYNQDHATAVHSRKHLLELQDCEKNLRDEIEIIGFVLDDNKLYNEYMRNIVLGKLKRAYVTLESEA
jgi:hypothetical protein